MKSTLYLKFIIIYIIFGFLSLFTVATLTSGLVNAPLTKGISSAIYNDANMVTTNYLPEYFSGQASLNNVHMQLSGMEQHLNAAIWFVDSDGTMITSAQSDDFPSAPYNVVDFNPAESGNEQYQIGDYHGYFNEDVITVIAPVIYDYSPKGYLLIHKSTDDIYELHDILMHSAYITLCVIFILSFVILLAFQFFVYRPLSKITEAAKQYASGNLEYEIPVNTED